MSASQLRARVEVGTVSTVVFARGGARQFLTSRKMQRLGAMRERKTVLKSPRAVVLIKQYL